MKDSQLVERVVQEVMRRLRDMESDGDRRVRPAVDGEQTLCAARSLAIENGVIALETIQGRLEGVQQIMVRRRAVVTPSVRDELNDRNIKLVRDKQ